MAVTIAAYEQLIELMGKGFDMGSDTFKAILLNVSHTRTLTNTLYSQISANELATANGYTNTGQALTTVTFAQTSGTVKFDSDSPTWAATGAGITAVHSAIYNDTATSPADALCVDISLDGSQTAAAGNNFIVNPHASNGWFTGSITAA